MTSNLEQYLCNNIPSYDIEDFIDRDISWISFNKRVLDCAMNKEFPINERWNFLSITASNLDEFMAVRFSSVIEDDISSYPEVLDGIKKFNEMQFKVYKNLKELTSEKGTMISKMKDLSKNEKEICKKLFFDSIFPILSPISITSTTDMPNLLSSQVSIAVCIQNANEDVLSIIQIPESINKLFRIGNKVINCEDIICEFLDGIYINKRIKSYGKFKIIKDLNLAVTHDKSKFIVERMNETLIKRKFSKAIILMVEDKMNQDMINILLGIFNLHKDRLIKSYIMDYKRFNQPLLPSDYSFHSYSGKEYEVASEQYSLFSSISEHDIILHHPFDSYDTVVKFVEHAATDEYVKSIKMTLYRVSSIDSPIINALVRAAKNGKSVSVLVEIKARFDEGRNIGLIDKLKLSGVNVLLGLEDLKTHCKMCLVTRLENDGLKLYSHLGTGNYNEKTAKIYTDISLFTSNKKIGTDLINIFNLIADISAPDEKFNKVFYAPVNLRNRLNKMISREIDQVKSGKDGYIFLKLNSLSDPEIVDNLYRAAANGVKIYIICRGVCSIMPKKNIYIKSIVGRFLEHSRIYYFKNGGDGDSEYYISSADLLTRNLDRRVEVMVQLTDNDIVLEMRQLIRAFQEDKKNSFEMQYDGTYQRLSGDFDAHAWFMQSSITGIKLKIPKREKRR